MSEQRSLPGVPLSRREEWEAQTLGELELLIAKRKRATLERARPTVERMNARSYEEQLAQTGRERLLIADEIRDIALRCYTEPVGFEPYVPKLDLAPFPDVALFLRLVPLPGGSDPLFGVAAFVSHVNGEQHVFRIAFHPEDLSPEDIEAVTDAARGCGVPPGNVVPWSAFLKLFYKWVYRYGYRVPVVAWRLPEQLSLLAADWDPAPDGGWYLYVWTQPDRRRKRRERRRRRRLRNGEIAHPRRPRIHVDPIAGGSARMRLVDRWGPDERDRIPEGETSPKPTYQFEGRFVDLADLSHGLAARDFSSLDDAASEFDVPTAAVTEEPPTEIAELMTLAFERIDVERQLYAKLLIEHEARGVAIHPHRVHSPAAYAWALERMAGLEPPLARWPGFPRRVLAKWFGAFHGGENRIGMLVPPSVPLPVTTTDFTGGYIAVAAMISLWRVLTARRIVVRKVDPAATERYVAKLAVKVLRWLDDPARPCPLKRNDLERLAWTVVDVIPRSDVLPYKRRNERGAAWRMHVGPLTHDEPVPFVLFDVLRSACETGAIPEIRSGHRLVPIGTIGGLKGVKLPDGTEVAAGDDLPLALGVFRRWLATRSDLDPKAKARLERWAKLVSNAIVSGLPAQVNRGTLHQKKARVRVVAPDGSERIVKTPVVEEPGAWSFSPAAAAVTAGQRFFTSLARGLLEARGGRVAYVATDSLGIVSTPDGAGVACSGGPDLVLDMETGEEVEGYRALSFSEVEQIRDALEALSPYPDEIRPRRTRWIPEPDYEPRLPVRRLLRRSYPRLEPAALLLKLEQENFSGGPSSRHQAYMFARSPMRAIVYTVQRAGMYFTADPPQAIDDRTIVDLKVLKASEQSLGQLLPPLGAGPNWIERVAEHELEIALHLEDPEPEWYGEPAVALIPVTSPGESMLGGADRRPWTLVAVFRPHLIYGPRLADGTRAVPAAVWHEGFDWRTEALFDFRTGTPLPRIHVGPRDSIGEQARVLRYGEVIRRHFSRVPELVRGVDERPIGAQSVGLLEAAPTVVGVVRLIGKEMNRLDRTGLTTNPDYSDYTMDAGRRRLALRVLRQAGTAAVTKASGHPERTVRRFVGRGRTRNDRWLSYFDAASQIARNALPAAGQVRPSTDEALWRAYLGLVKVCQGCATGLTGRQLKWCSACRALRSSRRASPHRLDEIEDTSPQQR